MLSRFFCLKTRGDERPDCAYGHACGPERQNPHPRRVRLGGAPLEGRGAALRGDRVRHGAYAHSVQVIQSREVKKLTLRFLLKLVYTK